MHKKSSKLSTKLTGILVGYLIVAVIAVGMTLWVAWQLEGGAAAVNQMGSERMRSYKIALLLAQGAVPGAADQTDLADATRAEIIAFEQVLAELEAGDPARPLVLPKSRDIRVRFEALKGQWREQMKPAIAELLDVSHKTADHTGNGALLSDYRRTADQFVGQIDALVYAIEQDISRNTTLLRSLQLSLIALSVVGTVTLIYLLFLLIIRPVTSLDEGMRRMEGGDFDVRLPVEARDEFGALAAGFNRMAAHLTELYRTLERRVADKTHSLEARNEELATLYESAALLSQPASLEDLCREFLRKLVARLGAKAGAVRLIQTGSGKIHLYVQEGMSAELVDAEHCLDRGECLCGAAAERPHPSIHVLARQTPHDQEYRCHKAGFQTVGVFPIRFRNQPLGVFNLYFDQARDLGAQERFMLETLGQHLGIAIENQLLVAREKEMAISEERNLLAQELHDSIAQSLAFLNLQAQMLQDSLQHDRIAEAREELARIREGIQESYDDVRELLVHFRTRLAQADIETTIGAALERFEGQTGIKVSFVQSGSGIPLSPEIQLQVLHIIQECLSNARKHSGAANVQVELHRGPVYRFRVTDDGKGFDPESTATDLHVGLSIMRERAHRIGGSLQVASRPGGGTEVTLTLPISQQAAA